MRNLMMSISSVYRNGTLPTLVYANKQLYGKKTQDRPLHCHDSICELLLCYRGFGIYYINNMQYPIQQGDIILYNMGDLHEVSSAYEDVQIGTYCFGLTDVNLLGLPYNHLVADDASYIRQSNSQFSLFCSLSEQTLLHCTQRSQDLFAAQLIFNTLFTLIGEQSSPFKNQAGQNTATILAARARWYIDNHFSETITLDKIAAQLNCSVTYLSHTFKSTYNYSPVHYLIRRRIGQAQTLLISYDYPIVQIAQLVGYHNAGHFHQLFLKMVGVTPAQYRKEYLENLRGSREQF